MNLNRHSVVFVYETGSAVDHDVWVVLHNVPPLLERLVYPAELASPPSCGVLPLLLPWSVHDMVWLICAQSGDTHNLI